MKTLILLMLGSCLFCINLVHAEEIFEPPVLEEGLIDKFNQYPPSERNMARTGRVDVSFMVDEKGNPFEVMVEQANNPKFIKPTIKSILAGKYSPATLNGVPVQAHKRTTERFNIFYDSRSPHVSTKKINKYLKKFSQEIEKENPDKELLTKYLKRMAGTKHGSQLAQKYLSYKRYQFALKFGDINDKVYAAREVLLSANEGRRVREFPQVRMNLIGHLINGGRLGEAWIEYYEARKALSGANRRSLADNYGAKINQIAEFIESDKPFERDVIIGDRDFAYLPLVKSSFTLKVNEGTIDSLKLRCERKFSELSFDQSVDYKIPESWGPCQLQVLGEQNSGAKLIQF